ncbi:MAG: methyltransferase, partial [Pseudomonadota bacterium]
LGDADVQKLLDKLKQAFGDKRPTLLVVDAVAAETGIDPAVASFDMQMLIGTRGRERTLAEWTALFEGACLRIEEVVEVRAFVSFIVVR